jgi:hypothetical protein
VVILLWQRGSFARRRRARPGHRLPCGEAQPFPDVCEDAFDQTRLISGGLPGLSDQLGFVPHFLLVAPGTLIADQRVVHHGHVPFVHTHKPSPRWLYCLGSGPSVPATSATDQEESPSFPHSFHIISLFPLLPGTSRSGILAVKQGNLEIAPRWMRGSREDEGRLWLLPTHVPLGRCSGATGS